MKLLRALCAGLLMVLAGCSSARIEDYNDKMPVFDIRSYLNGHIEAWGMFVDNAGKADPMFHVTLKGVWQGNHGTLDEHFMYSDGTTQDRLWTLDFQDEHHFTGTAPDVVGVAKGSQYGNAVNILYDLTVKTDSGSAYDMSMNDWLYRMNDELVLNRNEMRKFGIKLGELVISFRKLDK